MPPWPAPSDLPARVASAGLDLGPMGMAEHYHPQLQIIVHGKDVPVPANIGVDPATGAMSAVHTHEGDGTIHIEAGTAGEKFTLGQVFMQWGVKLTRTQIGGVKGKAGEKVTVTSNGAPVAGNPRDLRLESDQKIVLRPPMSALRLTQRIRPGLWTLAALGLIAIVVRRMLAWSPASTHADRNRPDGNDRARPGLVIKPADKRATAPTLEGDSLDAPPLRCPTLTGTIVVINVCGSWCGPCRAETPDLVRLAREYAGRGVGFVGINTRDNPAAARSFVRQFHVPYPSVEDTDGRLLLAFRDVIPTAVARGSVVIDPQEKIATRVFGLVTYSALKGSASGSWLILIPAPTSVEQAARTARGRPTGQS